MRLTQANLHSDLDAIAECQRVLTPVREAWNSIGSHPVVRGAAQGAGGGLKARSCSRPVRYRPNPEQTEDMTTELLTYYEAIEQASADMLNAARTGNWDEVVKLESACVLLISQLNRPRTSKPWRPTTPAARRASCSASCSTTPRSGTSPSPGSTTSAT